MLRMVERGREYNSISINRIFSVHLVFASTHARLDTTTNRWKCSHSSPQWCCCPAVQIILQIKRIEIIELWIVRKIQHFSHFSQLIFDDSLSETFYLFFIGSSHAEDYGNSGVAYLSLKCHLLWMKICRFSDFSSCQNQLVFLLYRACLTWHKNRITRDKDTKNKYKIEMVGWLDDSTKNVGKFSKIQFEFVSTSLNV